jgi:hypothetical protein
VAFCRGAQICVDDGNMKAHREVCLSGVELLQFSANGSDVFDCHGYLAARMSISVGTDRLDKCCGL